MQTRGNKRSNNTEERNSENSENKKKKIVENKIKKKVNKSFTSASESESKSKEIKKKDKASKNSKVLPSSKQKASNNTDPEEMRKCIFKLENVVRATVVNRPSKVIKSPYMADIIVSGQSQETLCHSPALGCAGIIVPGTNVIVTPKPNAKADAKSKYSLDLVDLGPSILGVNPLMCNKMVKTALEYGLVEGLPRFDKSEIKSEASIDESRFDFKCEQNGTTYYVEVKGVPCACIDDVPISPKKKTDMMAEINKAKNKIAYFPDGYRKPGEEVISPRALKHVQHLTRLAAEENTRCILLFVVQRTDCKIFQPTHNDPVYRRAVYDASVAGVRIIAHTVTWSEDGKAAWSPTLPINLHDDKDDF